MRASSTQTIEPSEPLPAYRGILLASDSSDHANRGIQEAVALARTYSAKVTGTHVYAAKMHDTRFRQMEGGLPEQFREEQELERQRDVHDDLISRGLSIITDSYLDQVDRACSDASIPFARRCLEGKNYRQLVRETNSGNYDLLIVGALGLGAVQGSRLGTVCQRVVRRTDIDTLVIKEPNRSIAEGPIVVAVDGSPRSYGGLVTALSLAQQWNVPVKVVAAFDPYYHYVAFNRIAGVLSEEAGKVFKFKEQEKLHEDIIDSGLAKIYQGHLEVAKSIAGEHGMTVATELLTGKPHDAITKHLEQVDPSLLVLGKLGIHADPDLDIGGNAENLLVDANCAVLLSQRTYRPRIDIVADVTTSWTVEAEQRVAKVPSFVQSMARMAILRYAQERGHTVITESIVAEATAQLMPSHAEKAMGEIVTAYDAGEIGKSRDRKSEIGDAMVWSDAAQNLLEAVDDAAVRKNLRMRAEKRARVENCFVVEERHINGFITDSSPAGTTLVATAGITAHPIAANTTHAGTRAAPTIHWEAVALARLMRVPEGFMRDDSKQRIETYARDHGITNITLEVAEAGLAEARNAMAAQMQNDGEPAALTETKASGSKCPFARMAQTMQAPETVTTSYSKMDWTVAAAAELERVPEGFCRDMTRKAAETIAAQKGAVAIELSFVENVMNAFASGSSKAEETLPWEDAARARIQKAPNMIRGMLLKEIESWARRNDLHEVNEAAVRAVKAQWQDEGQFHLDPNDPRRG